MPVGTLATIEREGRPSTFVISKAPNRRAQRLRALSKRRCRPVWPKALKRLGSTEPLREESSTRALGTRQDHTVERSFVAPEEEGEERSSCNFSSLSSTRSRLRSAC